MQSSLSTTELAALGLIGALAALFLVSLLDTLGLARTVTRVIGGGGYALSDQYELCRKGLETPAAAEGDLLSAQSGTGL